MNKKEFITAITFLNTAYNKEATQEQLSVWYEFFKNENYEMFKTAIKSAILKERFMPTIAVIKEELEQAKQMPKWFEMSQEELKDYHKIQANIYWQTNNKKKRGKDDD